MIVNWDQFTLQQLGDARRDLEEAIYSRVQEYRSAGVIWADIGLELRVTPQEANRRYRVSKYAAPLPRETPAD